MLTRTVLTPISRAVEQLGDRAFVGVLWRSVAWAAACFALLHAGAVWAVHRVLALHGPLAWLADLLGTVGVSLLAMWLFLPLAVTIGTLYLERIAEAVERRFYPWLPPGTSAPILEQVWDGVCVGLHMLALNVVALCFFFVPVIGWAMGWLIAAYAISRGLFVAVAMRRMPRNQAESLYRRNILGISFLGSMLALAGYVPILNFLLPVIATASMVHALNLILTGDRPYSAPRFDVGSYS